MSRSPAVPLQNFSPVFLLLFFIAMKKKWLQKEKLLLLGTMGWNKTITKVVVVLIDSRDEILPTAPSFLSPSSRCQYDDSVTLP
jgi:hypothetical protein